MRFWQLKNLKEFVETVCLSEKRLWFISILRPALRDAQQKLAA